MLKACIVGASGYLGGEAVRLLLSHPQVEIASVAANESAGKKLSELHPNLAPVADFVLEREDSTDFSKFDVVVLAMPNGSSIKVVPKIPQKVKVVDLGADFRIKDSATFEKSYKTEHTVKNLLGEFVYGSPELFRRRIKEATRVAAPGCFATASILSIWPLVLSDTIASPIFISGVTGSSGAGKTPKDTTHHPFRENSLFPYEPFHHRHIPEIEQAIKEKTTTKVEVILQPHSGPFVRGILATTFVTVKKGTDATEIFNEYYKQEPFVKIQKDPPNIKWVANSNYAFISVKQEGDKVIVFTAIDNLLKGGAGQGVQCLNIMMGFPEDQGLKFVASNP